MSQATSVQSQTPWSRVLGYAMGEGATSLTMNGLSAFAMLFYTQAMGLRFDLAGLAFSVSSLWDALIDPLVGHASDRTRSRWGRRHPYILVGGLLMAVCFYYMWAVPEPFSSGGMLFVYVLGLNLIYRTAYALFVIPYMALGFELCTEYHQRSQLQSMRIALNMLVNLLGPALAWSIFFPDQALGQGEATSNPGNFLRMGTWFAIAAAIFTIIVLVATRHAISDTRSADPAGPGAPPAGERRAKSTGTFWRDSREILVDRYLRVIMLFSCVGLIGAIFVSTLQMYLYVYYMHLSALQKTLTHGGGMVLCGLGAVASAPLARRVDKKQAVCIGAAITAFANTLAGVLFLGRVIEPGAVWRIGGVTVPIAVIAFGACNMINWFGIGIFSSLGNSMLADAAEVNELHSGTRKDGGYAAISAFLTKLVASVATFIASACLAWVGFVNGSDQQSPESIRWLMWLTFGLGALAALAVIPIVRRYPISREFMQEVKAALAAKQSRAHDADVAAPPPAAVLAGDAHA